MGCRNILLGTQPADTLCDPRLIVVVDPPLLLWVSSHVRHSLDVSRLRLQPLVDEELRVLKYQEVTKVSSTDTCLTLAKLRKNSRLVFRLLIVSTVS